MLDCLLSGKKKGKGEFGSHHQLVEGRLEGQ